MEDKEVVEAARKAYNSLNNVSARLYEPRLFKGARKS
jgi:hypothetical protein